MRYESALQIIRFLKDNYGTPAPILHIVDSIDLSYQPTHKHIYDLKRMGVIETAKEGRHVLCHLSASDATHLWLGIMSLEDAREAVQTDGIIAKVIHRTRSLITEPPAEGLQAVAVQTGAETDAPSVIVVTESHAKQQIGTKFATRCEGLAEDLHIATLTFVEVAEKLADPIERQRWIAHSIPLYGEQRFWQITLPRKQHPMGTTTAD